MDARGRRKPDNGVGRNDGIGGIDLGKVAPKDTISVENRMAPRGGNRKQNPNWNKH